MIGGVGNGLLNQTDGSIKDVTSNKNGAQVIAGRSEAHTNINIDQMSKSPAPNLNSSVVNEVMVDNINDP